MVARLIGNQHEGEFNMRKTTLILAGLLASTLSLVAQAAHEFETFEVTIFNITKSQNFTPILLATHHSSVSLFTPGLVASSQLEILAEGGATMPLQDLLDGNPDVLETVTTDGLLLPGQSVTVEIQADVHFNRLSITSMLIPTNDTFVGLRSMKLLPLRSTMFTLTAYDAGTELNDELCANIPGPDCGGEGDNTVGGEGFIFTSNGISGIGDLEPDVFDWRNPVARVRVKRK